VGGINLLPRITTQGFPGKGVINHSFEPLFRLLFNRFGEEISTVLEFGPGYSTCLLSELAPIALITSFENLSEWYEYHVELFKDMSNITLIQLQQKDGGCLPQKYIDYYIENPPDLVFIDGCGRTWAYDLCVNVIKPKFVAFHDAQWYFRFKDLGNSTVCSPTFRPDMYEDWTFVYHDGYLPGYSNYSTTYREDKCITALFSNTHDLQVW